MLTIDLTTDLTEGPTLEVTYRGHTVRYGDFREIEDFVAEVLDGEDDATRDRATVVAQRLDARAVPVTS